MSKTAIASMSVRTCWARSVRIQSRDWGWAYRGRHRCSRYLLNTKKGVNTCISRRCGTGSSLESSGWSPTSQSWSAPPCSLGACGGVALSRWCGPLVLRLCVGLLVSSRSRRRQALPASTRVSPSCSARRSGYWLCSTELRVGGRCESPAVPLDHGGPLRPRFLLVGGEQRLHGCCIGPLG